MVWWAEGEVGWVGVIERLTEDEERGERRINWGPQVEEEEQICSQDILDHSCLYVMRKGGFVVVLAWSV